MKVKLWTHNDLDGVGNNILAKLVYGNNVSISNVDYDNINEEVIEFIENDEIRDYDIIYFTDISVREDVAQMLNDYCSKFDKKVFLFDHHKTAMYLNKFSWAVVDEGKEECKNSGTSLFFDFLSKTNKLPSQTQYFSELVRKYDTWEWTRNSDDIQAKQLNDLYIIYGMTMFVEKMVERISTDERLLWTEDFDILEVERLRIERYVSKKQKTLKEFFMGKYIVGIVFAEQYFSDLTLTILNNNFHLDFLLIINLAENGVSYRTIKKDIDVSGIAKIFGGGGHPEASGSPLNCGMKELLIQKKII